jgi:hypothetical protein
MSDWGFLKPIMPGATPDTSKPTYEALEARIAHLDAMLTKKDELLEAIVNYAESDLRYNFTDVVHLRKLAQQALDLKPC